MTVDISGQYKIGDEIQFGPHIERLRESERNKELIYLRIVIFFY